MLKTLGSAEFHQAQKTVMMVPVNDFRVRQELSWIRLNFLENTTCRTHIICDQNHDWDHQCLLASIPSKIHSQESECLSIMYRGSRMESRLLLVLGKEFGSQSTSS